MVNEAVRDDLAAAERSFEVSPEAVEEGLDVDDPALVQLRRACRLLAAGARLLDNGYFTVVIESSFVAIERTIQFRLIHDGAMKPEQVISNHDQLYRRGIETGLFDETFGERLTELWNQNRSKTYYRLGIATENQARTMHRLASNLHQHLINVTGVKHECIC